MTSPTTRKRKSGSKPGPYVYEKKAFSEDADTDPTLSGVEKAILSVIVKSYSNSKGYAECAYTFLARGAGTHKVVAIRYTRQLVDKQRIFVVSKGRGSASTHWGVNWKMRGSAMVRAANDGLPTGLSGGNQNGTSGGNQEDTHTGDTQVTSSSRGGNLGVTQTLSSPKGERKATCAAGAPPSRAAPPAAAISRLVDVVGSSIQIGNGDTVLQLSLKCSDGTDCYLDIVAESLKRARQDRGQAELEAICIACGVDDIADADDLLGLRFVLTTHPMTGDRSFSCASSLTQEVAA